MERDIERFRYLYPENRPTIIKEMKLDMRPSRVIISERLKEIRNVVGVVYREALLKP